MLSTGPGPQKRQGSCGNCLCIFVFIIVVLRCPIINYIFHVPSANTYLQCYLLCVAPVFRHTLCKYLTKFYFKIAIIVHKKCHTCVFVKTPGEYASHM